MNDERSADLLCDYCGSPVYVRGVKDPTYVHEHGSVFCMAALATVDGRNRPE